MTLGRAIILGFSTIGWFPDHFWKIPCISRLSFSYSFIQFQSKIEFSSPKVLRKHETSRKYWQVINCWSWIVAVSRCLLLSKRFCFHFTLLHLQQISVDNQSLPGNVYRTASSVDRPRDAREAFEKFAIINENAILWKSLKILRIFHNTITKIENYFL